MGKGKTALSINYERAIAAALESSYISYDDLKSLVSTNRSPEERAIRKNLFEKLSKKAQQVILLIIDPNDEQEKKIKKPKHGSVSRTQLRGYLRKELKWTARQVDQVWDEIVEDFLKNL